MYYLNQADREVYNAFNAWVPRALSKSEKLIVKIAESNAFAQSLMGHVRDMDDGATQRMMNEQFALAEEIRVAFSHMFDRRNLAIRALQDPEAVKELIKLYPNVEATELHKNKPTKGLLGVALSGNPNEAVAAAQEWFDKMLGALSICPVLKDYYLVYSGVGPAKPLIHRSAIETKSSLLYGIAVHPTAQKTFIELFNVRAHSNLRLILDYELHKDPAFNKGAVLEIAPRQLEGFLKNHTVLDFNYRGHKATFFTKM